MHLEKGMHVLEYSVTIPGLYFPYGMSRDIPIILHDSGHSRIFQYNAGIVLGLFQEGISWNVHEYSGMLGQF
jgi:hypothetical protein